jgi:quercetin dioxygenase-like cupin family protein
MKTTTKLLIGAAAISATVGIVFATPIINLAAGIVGAGNSPTSLNAHGVAKQTNGDYFNAYFETEGPSSITTTMAGYTEGGQNGWHSHPGFVINTLKAGSIQWYNANCDLTVYYAGDSWVEGSQIHYLRVLGATPVQFVTTYVVGEGMPNRIDQPAPPCAAAAGIDH